MTDVKNEKIDELKKLLESLNDSYDDFVRGLLHSAKKSESIRDKIILYIKDSENVTTSDVIDYLDELEGIKKM